MGYISRDIELDAILTKRGRELLTNRPDDFKITKFSLFDDEMDYRLWNTSHSLGSDYYGELLENTPIIEPLPDDQQQAKFNLITLPKETTNLPLISLGASEIELKAGQEYIVFPQSNPNTFNLAMGYSLTIWDFDFGLSVDVEEYLQGDNESTAKTLYLPAFDIFGSSPKPGTDSPSRITARGFSFKLIAGEFEDSANHRYVVTVRGRETGARVSILVTVKGKYAAQLRA